MAVQRNRSILHLLHTLIFQVYFRLFILWPTLGFLWLSTGRNPTILG